MDEVPGDSEPDWDWDGSGYWVVRARETETETCFWGRNAGWLDAVC